MANPRKAFPVDPGLIPVFDRSGRANLGHALETAVALELLRRGAEIAYLRTAENLEVDFLARTTDGREQLIQVCADLDSPQTREREVRALSAAANDYPRAEQHLVTLAADAVRGLPAEVRLHSAATWLLNPEIAASEAAKS
jgi:predicted AAA+ superfamily ATPase